MKTKFSTILSLVICGLCVVLLVVASCTFPTFLRWLYLDYHNLQNAAVYEEVVHTVIPAFYCCVPIAGAALGMMIRILVNVLRKDIFIRRNVTYFRLISWCCYAVCLITLIFGTHYVLLEVIAIAMGIIGTLLRVVKNIMQAAVEIREENDLTI